MLGFSKDKHGVVLANLVPEAHLLEGLSPIWRRRFEQALSYIRKCSIEGHIPTWGEVCQVCSVSEFHFHRMFKLVFGETSGQYINRIRLQMCVFLLINEPEIKITEIAHELGYSSSQAMAKALKKLLGMNATQIRDAGGLFDTAKLVIDKLGHPDGQFHLERQLSQQMCFTVVDFPERYFYACKLKEVSFFGAYELWQQLKPEENCELVSLIEMQTIDSPIAEQKVMIGYELKESAVASFSTNSVTSVPRAKYLTTQAIVNSEAGYYAMWDALYAYVATQDIEPQAKGMCIEITHNPEAMLSEPSHLTIGIPID